MPDCVVCVERLQLVAGDLRLRALACLRVGEVTVDRVRVVERDGGGLFCSLPAWKVDGVWCSLIRMPGELWAVAEHEILHAYWCARGEVSE